MKQPRCFNKVYKFKNGKYALFFHNNGGRHYSSHPLGSRNPTWLAGGIEKDGYIYWSQPEVFLYDMNYGLGISYPDWIEDNEEYYFSETQKSIARIHRIPNEFLEMLWTQAENHSFTEDGIILELTGKQCKAGKTFTMPDLGRLSEGEGFALELNIQTEKMENDQVILDTRLSESKGYGYQARFKGNGLKITLKQNGSLEVLMDDGRSPLIWTTPPKSIKENQKHHLVLNVDAKSKILSILLDGDLNDGGDRPFGFARFNPYMHDVNGVEEASFSSKFNGKIDFFRIYDRFLFTSEAIGNYRSQANIK